MSGYSVGADSGHIPYSSKSGSQMATIGNAPVIGPERSGIVRCGALASEVRG